MARLYNTKKDSRSIFLGGEWVDLHNKEWADVDDTIAFYGHRLDHLKVDGTPPPFRPEAWSKERKLIWETFTLQQANGYGSVSQEVLASFDRLGIDVRTPAIINDPDHTVPGRIYEIAQKRIEPDLPVICYGLPYIYEKCRAQMKLGYTMFENTKLPSGWTEQCNTMNAMIVPSQNQKEIFADNGVKVPILVFKHGVNQDYFHYVERPKRQVYTFIDFAAPISVRKGGEYLYKAFKAAFPTQEDVRLVIKTTEPFWLWGGLDDPRVDFIKNSIPPHEMLDILYDADCMVFPTHGEGFGLPPIQAMATGLPTIVTNWSGCTEYANPEYCYPINYKMIPSPHWDTGGEWAEPDFDHLVELMRYCYNNREEAAAKGKKAAEWIKQQWTWDSICTDFIKQLDNFLCPTL